jgi:general secretion pathway protein D
MKKLILVTIVLLWSVAGQEMFGQAIGDPSVRKELRQYTAPGELVSIAPTTTLDKALSVISEVSKKFVNKIVIDTEHRTFPINVDIQGMPWRDALEAICRKNDIWYTEYENYIQLTTSTATELSKTAGQGAGIQTTGPAVGVGEGGFRKEVANFHSREIKISAVFFEVDLDKLNEVGIDWTFMKSTSDFDITAQNFAGGEMSKTLFKTEVTPKLSFANINLVGNLFSTYNLGEILSGPQLTVRSGEEGRIQVGQDFSIRERDFAGNLIDKFYSAGTIVKVTPQVITEQGVNFVHMTVEVERSSVAPGTTTTIVNKTKANTNLLLLDGEETIIGGLYNSETTTVRSGVPFLKDLPWYVLGLRYLFGYNKDEVVKKELVILMKAELVPTLQERITQKSKEDGIFDRWLQDQMRYEQHVTGRKSE